MNVNLDGGMQEEYFAASQSIIENKTRGRNKPYFHGIDKEPINLTVNFAFENGWDNEELKKIRRWLTSPKYYAPLAFSNEPEKIYYALYIDEPVLLHNSMSQGYITIRFRCNGSYAYTPLMTTPEYTWTDIDLNVNVTNFSVGERVDVTLTSGNKIQLNSSNKRLSEIFAGNKTLKQVFE